MPQPVAGLEPLPRPQAATHPGMIFVPGGTFRIGSRHHYSEEAPVHRVAVDGFWMDKTPVTKRQFAAFVEATGCVTFAELAPNPKDYPGVLPYTLYPGSLVFHPLLDPVGLMDHPVVHVSFADARAYANWAGKELPGEAQFEYAVRGGLDSADYAWVMN